MRRENNYGPFDGSNASKSQDRRLHVRAWCSIYYGWLRPNDRVLRDACGYGLANRGHDTRALQAYLGQNIQHTVRYTELSPTRFKNFWRE